MKRQDQIKEMAQSNAKHMTCDKDMQVAFADALRRGAEWSDEHPDIDVRTMAAWQSGYQSAIDKACEWLERNEVEFWNSPCNPDKIVEQFRKAMNGD